MSFGLIAAATASSGRFVPPITVARTGLGLSAGQFKITTPNYSIYNYVLTGANTTRAADIVSLTATTATGTVQPFAPKGVVGGTVVNVARTPYTYHSSYHHNPKCASHWHSGQCAQWGPPNTHYNGEVKNSPPANYSDSEGEWWRIW